MTQWVVGGIVVVLLLSGAWQLALIVIVIAVVIASSNQKGKTPPNTDRPLVRASAPPQSRADGVSIRISYGGGSDDEQPSGQAAVTIWVAPGASATVHGMDLSGGMLYIGGTLTGARGATEPAQIDPRLSISAAPVSSAERTFGYWPSYSSIGARGRKGYLTWLAGGRMDPSADIGYVFLFFYGLERRVLVDAVNDEQVRAEFPAIVRELRRLQEIYGNNRSFARYSNNLLEVMLTASARTLTAGDAPPPVASRGDNLMAIRTALGQMALSATPVPAAWAWAWAQADSEFKLPSVARKEPELFARLFTARYFEKFGPGLVLPANKTRLRVSYLAASSALAGEPIAVPGADVPDVSAITSSIRKLQAIIDDCPAALSAYRRHVAQNPGSENSFDAGLLLPPSLWPTTQRNALEETRRRVGADVITMSVTELAKAFGGETLNRERFEAISKALEAFNIGVEPDVLGGARMPRPDSRIALFAAEPSEGTVHSNSAYQAAAVTLDLAAAVAAADGQISSAEVMHLGAHIDSWRHLSAAHRKRLRAHLRRLFEDPPSLPSLRKRLEPLSADARRATGRFLAHLGQVDGAVSPDEVKLLERVYKTLGLDPQAVYADLHMSAASDGTAAPAVIAGAPVASKRPSKSEGHLVLDPARIHALQKETEEVSAMLAQVFVEEMPSPPSLPTPDDIEPEEALVVAPAIAGLDAAHAAFARTLLARPTWARSELATIASNLDLMLDGALERVNEAAVEVSGIPLVEGDEALSINPESLHAFEEAA